MRDFHMPGRSAVLAANAMVATSHPLAAQVALDTLKRGGNAVDGAIAGAILLGVCEPHMAGLGGDCFALIKPAGTNQVLGLNGSGRAPAGVCAQSLRERGLDAVPVDGVEAITLPGAVDAFCTLSAAHGRLELPDILNTVIPYFEAGVPVAARVAFDWPVAAPRLHGRARAIYLPGGAPARVGTRFALPGQAEVLRAIARKGRAGFYHGPVARDVVQSLAALGGCHTGADMAAAHSTWTTPIRGAAGGGTELIEHPPNGQGATAILLGKILGHFDIAALDPFGARRAHIEAEATKLAHGACDRAIAEPAQSCGLEETLSDATALKLAGRINPDRATVPTPHAVGTQAHRDTVYITVADRDTMMVSLIYSIFHAFGSGHASDRFGILFHNRGAGFTLRPDHPNELGPGKRPFHTIIPGMLARDGQVNMSFGVMGGAYQPTGHARLVSNLIDFGLDLQSAIDAPRSFAEEGTLKVERGYPASVRRILADMGHDVVVPDGPLGGAQAIGVNPGGYFEGASDPRKDGCALGY